MIQRQHQSEERKRVGTDRVFDGDPNRDAGFLCKQEKYVLTY